MLLDDLAYTNSLRGIHPGEKLAFAVGTMAIGFIPSWISNALIVIVMALVCIVLARIPAKVYLKLMLLPLVFLAVGLLPIIVTFSAEGGVVTSVSLLGLKVFFTVGNIELAAHLFFRAVALVSCMYFLSLTTPILDLVPVLRRLKVPELFLEIMLIIYRYLFAMSRTVEDIYTAQASRQGHRSFRESIKSWGMLVSSLFIKSRTDAQDLYMSLNARCYCGDLVVMEREFTLSTRNLIFIGAVDMLLLLIALKTGGGL